MRLRFAYPGPEGDPFDVPPDATVVRPAPVRGDPRDVGRLARAALSAPDDAPPLVEAAQRARGVLVLVDDATRKTPTAGLLPHVVRVLEDAGVPDERITLLVAQGTHRRMTSREVDQKIGAHMRTRFRVVQHDHRDGHRLVGLGSTADGMPIVVHRLVPEHDLVVGIGTVGVHAIMGYSGGAKICIIGATGEATEVWTHTKSLDHPITALLGDPDNPIRRNIEAGARVAGLDAVLNVTLDPAGQVGALAYGDCVAAHRRLVADARRRAEVPVGPAADIVVAEARPADRDLWQSVKALAAASTVATEGGSIVLAAPEPEGIARNHPALARLAGSEPETARAAAEDPREADRIGAAVAARVAEIRARNRVHIVTGGIPHAGARRLGLRPHARMQDAIDATFAEQGPNARPVVLCGAGALLPVTAARAGPPVRLGAGPVSDPT